MAKCAIHGGTLSDNSVCARCKSCSHPSFWMNGYDEWKDGFYRCNNCYKVFTKVPVGSEVWVLLDSKWVLEEDVDKDESEVEVVAPETGEKKCLQCGSLFIPSRKDAKFCGPKCKLRFNRKGDTDK